MSNLGMVVLQVEVMVFMFAVIAILNRHFRLLKEIRAKHARWMAAHARRMKKFEAGKEAGR